MSATVAVCRSNMAARAHGIAAAIDQTLVAITPAEFRTNCRRVIGFAACIGVTVSKGPPAREYSDPSSICWGRPGEVMLNKLKGANPVDDVRAIEVLDA